MSKFSNQDNRQSLKQQQDKNNKNKNDEKPSPSPACCNASPPAFNPKYAKHAASRSRSSSFSLDRETSATASTPIEIQIQTVDPLIASIFQQGFPSNFENIHYDHEDHINNSEWLQDNKENGGLPGNIEYVIMDESPEEYPTAPSKRSRVSFLHRPNLASNYSESCHHPTAATTTTATTATAVPKVVPLTEQGTVHYGKAHTLAWRTQRASKAAFRKALQLPKKHSPKAKAVALKSVEVVKEVSKEVSFQSFVDLARKHSPIRRHSR
ncbi:MAG: hypothetical protein SGBAC_006016 [Bacillariaceae sp.]